MVASADLRRIYPILPADRAPRAVYIHVPFCIHRCGYCDFTLVAGQDELIPAYLSAMAAELAQITAPCEVDTIFVGGGTPSQLSADQLQQLLSLVTDRFPLAAGGEFSLEANPDGLDNDKLSAIHQAGVNRLSLGIQSFDQSTLSTLERQHSPEEAADVVTRADRLFGNLSADLIFGVPGLSLATWQQTLEAAVRLPVRHLSTYGLTFEKGTDFFRRQQAGQLQAVPDELERQMYAEAMSRLPDAGFEHYEISNFAQPGFTCRHNMVYWQAAECFAFGPGAARYVDGIRSTNARSVTRWLRAWSNGEPALQDVEELTSEHRLREAVFLGLRRIGGIDLNDFQRRFAADPREFAQQACDANLQHQLLEIVDDHLRLTAEGRFVADSVVLDFL